MAQINKKELTLNQKCLYAFLLIILCRVLSGVPTPFVDREYLKAIMEQNSALSILNTMSGNSLGNLSIMALGITPFITASIVMQLMGVVIPRLDELRNGMADEREKLEKITIILGCALSFAQGIGMGVGFGHRGMFTSDKWYVLGAVALIWMAGTLFEALIGKFISDKLIGNGVSMILLANILSSYPSDMYALFSTITVGKKIAIAVTLSAVAVLGIVFMFAFTVYMEGCEKRIPVMYTQKVGGYNSPKIMNYIPIKLCPGSVVPVIFTASIFSLPGMIALFTGKTGMNWLHFFDTSCWFNTSYAWYYSIGALVYVLLIFGFSYYYVNIEINPIQTSMNIKKAGGLIPGVKPGRNTSEFIRQQMKYTIFIGAIALSFIAIVPIVLGGLFSIPRVSFLGTSIIITCGVILETRKAILAESKGKIKKRKRGGMWHG